MKYYPIGTVVILKGGNRPIMIYGRQQIQASSNLIWDYVACLYPEGNLGDDYNIFFQHEEVERVLYPGFASKFDDKMQEILNSKTAQ